MTPATKRKTGIRRKIIAIIIISNLTLIAVGCGIGYFLGYRLIYNLIGEQYDNAARILANDVAWQIKGEAEDVRTYAERPLWLDAVKEANKKYDYMDDKSKQAYFADMDKRWSEETEGALSKEYLENRISVSAQVIVNVRPEVAEIFITDRFGGLVAASGKTSDFYQADEGWWQAAYAEGKGSIFMSDVEFDESSKAWAISFAAPMKDENGAVIGVCKQSIRMGRLFARLSDFRIGNTGHAVLVNQAGNIIYHEGIAPLSARFCDKDLLKDAVKKKKKYMKLTAADTHRQESFAVFAQVSSPLLSRSKMIWMVFIVQDIKEAFRPLDRLIFQLFIVISILLVIMWPVGYLFGSILVRPIHELYLAAEKILEGQWDYPLDIKTNDEIEQFADAFKEMTNGLKIRQEDLTIAKLELEELSRGLERKVRERTNELERAQEATLNVLEDLTEAKARLEKYARELEEAIKVKSEFTSTVSHELRTPLAAIKEGIAIVLDGTSGALGEEQKKFLDIAKRNVDRLARIINDLLDFQKLESGKMPFGIEEHDINETVKEAAVTMVSLAEQKGLEFILNLDDSLPKIDFDRDKILQVLLNLINNAVKFTEKGTITVVTSLGDNFVKVSVQDTGPGIRKEDIPKLFQQYEQLGKGIERTIGGTGLGLVISREIIEGHKGKVWAESEFGKGSSFNFVLPVKERRGVG